MPFGQLTTFPHLQELMTRRAIFCSNLQNVVSFNVKNPNAKYWTSPNQVRWRARTTSGSCCHFIASA